MTRTYSLFIVAGIVALGSSASAQINGFNNGTGWTNNNADGPVATFGANSATLTYLSSGNTHNSVFYATPQSVGSFDAKFDYQADGGADGATFVIQNAGANAVTNNDGGSGLGYEGMGSSVAIAFNIYGGHTIGTNLWTDGSNAGYNNTQSGTFDLTQDLIAADISYNGTTLTETLTDTKLGGVYTNTYNVDIASLVGGSTAYFGFTGGDGGGTSTQTFSNVIVATPEPSTYAVFGLGVLGLVIRKRRRA